MIPIPSTRCRRYRHWPIWAALAAALALGLAGQERPAAAVFAPSCDWGEQSYTDFYAPPDLGEFAPERLGELLRVEHMRTVSSGEVAAAAGVPVSAYGAEVYRILYLSQGPTGNPQAVSGLLVVPVGEIPEDGYPLIVHGHGTTGGADRCAPSQNLLGALEPLAWVAHGIMVSATDYVGLGTPGLHPYMVGDAAGTAMLDAGRAARNFCDDAHGFSVPVAGQQVVLEGHSQGGHSALFAHQIWPEYAPELDVVGTVAFAPGSELRLLAEQMAKEISSPLIAPLVLAMNAYQQAYGRPENLQSWLLEPYATDLADRVEELCLVGISGWTGLEPAQVFQPELLDALQESRWPDLEPWTEYIDANTPGNYRSEVPVLVLQGRVDTLVAPQASEMLTRRLCEQGTSTRLNHYPSAGHSTVVRTALPDALEWIQDRLAGRAVVDSCTQVPGTQESRSMEPVILRGAQVGHLVGVPVDELFVYVYSGEGWRQIPAQVDEVSVAGELVMVEDGRLDGNDQIVFMAQDLGAEPPPDVSIADDLPISATWYKVEVIDPVQGTAQGWAFLVHSTGLAPSFADYVAYDAAARRIRAQSYRLGLAESGGWLDHLSLGQNEVSLLDRSKFRLYCAAGSGCPLTEETAEPVPDMVVVGGPVRVILQNGRIAAYASLVTESMPVLYAPAQAGDVRFALDFAPEAALSTYYSAVVPQGVTVDGRPDAVPAQPVSPWWQLSTVDGTVIQAADVAAMAGFVTNHYVDNEVLNETDTGDGRRYGEAGFYIANPDRSFTYRSNLYFLPGTQPNVGADYAVSFQHPLVATAYRLGVEPPSQLYLPVISH